MSPQLLSSAALKLVSSPSPSVRDFFFSFPQSCYYA
uniref:Uncharacterized protein n=1 Tax=Arundo donax TaxID=35708 RepID=A0A0A9FHW8_ARUDO